MTAAKVAQRTPGPWHVAKGGVNIERDDLDGATQIATVLPADYGPNPVEQRANAVFIVRACNGWDQLLADMRIIANSYTTDEERIRIARAAITRAEEA